MLFDSGYDLLYLTADTHLGAQKFLGLLDFLTGDDLTNLKLHLCEIVECDLRLCLDVDDVFLGLCSTAVCDSLSLLDLLSLCLYLVHVKTGKQNLRLVGYLCAIDITTEMIHLLQWTLCGTDLCKDTVCGIRHKCFQQACADSNAL